MGVSRVTGDFVQKDIDTVESMRAIVTFANEQYLHVDPAPKAAPPTYASVRDAMRELWRMLERYQYLLNDASISPTIAHPGDDWMEVFRTPWLAPGATMPKYESAIAGNKRKDSENATVGGQSS